MKTHERSYINYEPQEVGLNPPTDRPGMMAYWRGDIGIGQDRNFTFRYEDPMGRREVLVGDWEEAVKLRHWVKEQDQKINDMIQNPTDRNTILWPSDSESFVELEGENKHLPIHEHVRYTFVMRIGAMKDSKCPAVAWLEGPVPTDGQVSSPERHEEASPTTNPTPTELIVGKRYRHIIYDKTGVLVRATRRNGVQYGLPWDDTKITGLAQSHRWAEVLEPVGEDE